MRFVCYLDNLCSISIVLSIKELLTVPLTNHMNVNIFVISADPRNTPENPFPRSSSLMQSLGPLKEIANFSTFIPSKSSLLVKCQISIFLETILFSFF